MSEKVDTEQLTEEERTRISQALSDMIASTDEELAAVAKLLRIHDALQARVTELERRPPMVHLDHVPSLEERKVLRDLLMPPGMRTADLSDPTVLTSHWSVRCEECRVQGMSSHREDCSRRPKG